MMYALVHILPVFIFRLKKLRKDPVRCIQIALKNWAQSTAYLTLQSTSIEIIYVCVINKWLFRYERLSGILSILIGSLSILFETASRRGELALYVAPKCLEALTNMG
jgi:hypothetical protein